MTPALAPPSPASEELMLIPKIGFYALPDYFRAKPPSINCDICGKKGVLFGYHVQFNLAPAQQDPALDLCKDCAFFVKKKVPFPDVFAKKYASFLPISEGQMIEFEPRP